MSGHGGLRVLFLDGGGPQEPQPWFGDLERELEGRHRLFRLPPEALQSGGMPAHVDAVVDYSFKPAPSALTSTTHPPRLWQILGTGYDQVDVRHWAGRGVPVAHCPGQFSGASVADCALMLMLMLARRYPTARAELGAGLLSGVLGSELAGRTLLLVGLGASGKELAVRARACGMRIAAVDVRPVGEEERRALGLVQAASSDALDDLLPAADFVSLHVPLSPGTRHLLDGRRLGLLPPHALLVNTSRGEIVDETALIAALHDGRLAGAGLDVFSKEPVDPSNPLLAMSNVVATPHIGGVTDGVSRRRAQCVAENLDRVSRGEAPLYSLSV